MERYHELIEKIKQHTLGEKEEAFSLYNELCDCLKEKYGLVNRDYDETPTKRGKEWIDIHHIREYELDDIARRTIVAKQYDKECRNAPYENKVVIALKSSEWGCVDTDEIRKKYPDKEVSICYIDYTLKDLKPYNAKEQLVYANKIEHFLLHYLIVSYMDSVFSGGPNYLWDDCVALDIYDGMNREFMNKLKEQKKSFYSDLSSEEITLLYKKLIDWKGWHVDNSYAYEIHKQCGRYWKNYHTIIRHLNERGISYIEDKDKFFRLFDILGYTFDKDTLDKINSCPFKVRVIEQSNGRSIKRIGDHFFDVDEKTIIKVRCWRAGNFTIPYNVERIADNAFYGCTELEKITIPLTVKEIENKAFTGIPFHEEWTACPNLKEINYKGTRAMWEEKFSNVEIPSGAKVVCKKR